MLAAKTSTDSRAVIINDMSAVSFFGKEYINTIAIIGGVIGFWGGIFVIGIVYLFLVCIRRYRRQSTAQASSGGVLTPMMGTYSADWFDCRPVSRTDLQPRERKAKKANHTASFYSRGPRRRDQDSGGMSLGKLGKFKGRKINVISIVFIKIHEIDFKEQYRSFKTRNAGCDEVRKYGKSIISGHYLIVEAMCNHLLPYPVYISFSNVVS